MKLSARVSDRLAYLTKAELVAGAERTAAGKVDLQALFGFDVAALFIFQRGDDFAAGDVGPTSGRMPMTLK